MVVTLTHISSTICRPFEVHEAVALATIHSDSLGFVHEHSTMQGCFYRPEWLAVKRQPMDGPWLQGLYSTVICNIN